VNTKRLPNGDAAVEHKERIARPKQVLAQVQDRPEDVEKCMSTHTSRISGIKIEAPSVILRTLKSALLAIPTARQRRDHRCIPCSRFSQDTMMDDRV
jgi:hypothetical protein